jgi:hypothetical protein
LSGWGFSAGPYGLSRAASMRDVEDAPGAEHAARDRPEWRARVWAVRSARATLAVVFGKAALPPPRARKARARDGEGPGAAAAVFRRRGP